jgi:DNA polymerase I
MPKNTPKKEVFLIVDALALIHRAFHAIPPLQTRDGRLVNAVYGFVSILMRAIKETGPKYVAVAFDRKEPTFRHVAFKEYKAQREKKPDDLYAQIPLVDSFLAMLKIPRLSKAGYEADDIIATLCARTKSEKRLSRIILTGDKDTLQLVDADTSVLTPGKGIKDTFMYGVAEVRERFGLEPGQMVDFKALRGDPSDNIPGVRGIGEVGASKLLKGFGTLENLYEQIEKGSAEADEIPKKQKAALIEFREDALKAKELVQLIHDVPVTFGLKDAELQEPDHEEVIKALSDLDFKSMVPRVLEAMPGGRTPLPATGGVPLFSRGANITPPLKREGRESSWQVVGSVSEMSALIKGIKEQEKIALRTFFGGHFLDKKLEAIAVAWADAAYVIPATSDNLKKLAGVFADPAIGKICHNAKADLEILGALGLELRGVVFDTMLASYVLNPGSRATDLETLAFSELARELPEKKVQIGLFAEDGGKGMGMEARWAAEAQAVWELAPKLDHGLKEESLKDVFGKMELPLAPVLGAMEKHGIELDCAFLSRFSSGLTSRIAELESGIREYAGDEVNISSPQQLAAVLFEKLQIQKKVHIRKTEGGTRYSTAAGELEKLKDAHPIIPLILEHRELAKLVSTYVDALPKLVRKDTGRVHTTFNQTVTATGRLSSSDPNLQNIPIRTELGRETRKAFVAAPGRTLIVADYSQIELRILAHLSADPALIEAFRSGQDIHKRTASEIWGIAFDDVTKEQRSAAKAVNFGIAYGVGANALAENAGITRDEARAFIEKYFLTFGRVGDFLERVKEDARRLGYTETLFGRRRYLPELKSHIPYLRAAGERMAINAPIQGTNADAIKLAMIELHAYLADRFGLGPDAEAKMLLQVHDELVFEAKHGLEHELAGVIKEKMEKAITLSVPVVVDVRIGKSWGELEKV